MAPSDPRRYLALLLVASVIVATLVLSRVLAVVFFAITVGYVLYPVRRALVERGVSPRIAGVGLTALSLVGLLVVAGILLVVVYRRLPVVVGFLQSLPDTIAIEAEGLTYVLETNELVASVRRETSRAGIRLARRTPVLALESVLFAVLVYELLSRPAVVRDVSDGLVPPSYRDVVESIHERTRRTLYGIYVVQATTAILTFLVSLPVFFLFGYPAFLSLAVLAAVLQFLPFLGPWVVVVGLVLYDIAIGQLDRALLVGPVGIALVGLLPDAVLRPLLASRTAGLSASVYLVGFVGGVLSLGPIGVVAGPLAVALVLESLDLVATGTR